MQRCFVLVPRHSLAANVVDAAVARELHGALQDVARTAAGEHAHLHGAAQRARRRAGRVAVDEVAQRGAAEVLCVDAKDEAERVHEV